MDRWWLLGWLREFRARSREPWYRRADVWVLVGSLLLPFGWAIALCRIGWAYLSARRAERIHREGVRPPLARPPVLAAERARPPRPPAA